MGCTIGIDLGTTNTAFAVMDPKPMVVDSKEGRSQIRSIVSQKKLKGRNDGRDVEMLVGDRAENNWEIAARDTIYSVKRLMGRGVADPEVQKIQKVVQYGIVQPSNGTKESVRVLIGGKEYSPVEVSAMILKKVKEDAEFRIKKEVTHAVITVPAYFSQIQREATRRAGLKAGLKVIKVLDEPTAAAIAYGVEFPGTSDVKYLLVYDLGGETFDISLLMWGGNVFAPLSLQGDMWLGGDNFDQIIIDKATRYIHEEYGIDPRGDARFMVSLRMKARQVKEQLSGARSADLLIAGQLRDAEGDLIDVEMEFLRDDFETWISPLIDKSLQYTDLAIKEAGLEPEQIHFILVVGNATSTPLVHRKLEAKFGKEKILRNIHPKHCVALGAAIVAARIGEQLICQAPNPSDPKRECGHINRAGATACERCGNPLGIEEEGKETSIDISIPQGGIAPFHYGTQTAGDEFNVFIRKSDPYPTVTPITQTFYTTKPNQRMISIPVFGGEHLDKASRNEKQGEAFAILPPGRPRETPVRITMWLDSDGIFGLSAYLEDGLDLKPWIIQGDADHRALEELENADRMMAGKGQSISEQKIDLIEKKKEEFFEKLQKQDYGGARESVDRMIEVIDDSQPEIDKLLENQIAYSEFIAREYGWALGADATYQLNKKVEEAKGALASNDREEMQNSLSELQIATEKLPEIVTSLIGIFLFIINRIQPSNPDGARELLREFSEIKNAFQQNPSDQGLMKRVEQFMVKLNQMRVDVPEMKQETCVCGAPLSSQRYCPQCKRDNWLVDKSKSSGLVKCGSCGAYAALGTNVCPECRKPMRK
jgi:molecular chaperone DnaK